MFTSGLILGMAIGALAMMVATIGACVAIIRQRGESSKDMMETNAEARKHWQLMAEMVAEKNQLLLTIAGTLARLADKE